MPHPKNHNQRLLDKINLPRDLRRLPIKKLPSLARELRDEMIATVAQTGGHLGASLGVVELTIALHYVFDTPNDLVVWDIGHQSYPHKMLTGRRQGMPSLRREGGLSGFTMMAESNYDHFGAGHSSTAISAALGMMVAEENKSGGKKNNKVIAVIGDGAMSAGMAFEAMNNAGAMKKPLIVILNDNDMSIAPPVGALSDHLTMLLSSKPFIGVRQLTFNTFDFLPKPIKKKLRLTESYVRGLVSGDNFFEHLGFYYVGVIDGHNIHNLISVLQNLKAANINGPILLHVVTQKGKGYAPAEQARDKFHGVTQFDIDSGRALGAPSKYDSYTKIFGNSLLALMKKDKTIAAITAAMPSGTGLDKVAEQLPDAVFDVGIAEQHAVTFAAGMATRGGKPFVAIYSTFLQRAFDQVVHDVAVQNLPVRFVLDRAGFVGADGATHHGAFDLAYLCPLPHFVIMAPKDGPELTAMLDFMANHNKGPIAIRFPRGEAAMLEQTTHMELKKMSPISLGKAELLLAAKEQENQPSNGRNNIALWALGSMVEKTWRAIALLRQQGQHELADNLTLINARFAKPLDRGLIKKLAANHRLFITLEEGSIGGFYSQMANALQAMALTAGVNENGIALQGRYFPDHFIEQASVDSQLTEAQLSPETIANFILASHSAIKNKL